MPAEEALKRSEQRTIARAKEKTPEERDLLETLLAADIPMGRAVSLIIDETSQAIRGETAQLAWLIRESRMIQFPEGSEVRRRLGMIADMLDPTIEHPHWDFGPESHAST